MALTCALSDCNRPAPTHTLCPMHQASHGIRVPRDKQGRTRDAEPAGYMAITPHDRQLARALRDHFGSWPRLARMTGMSETLLHYIASPKSWRTRAENLVKLRDHARKHGVTAPSSSNESK